MENASIKFKYDVENINGGIDLYDAGIALSGISRSLAISIHYLINGRIIKQAPSLDGASINLLPPARGSFIFDVDILSAASTIAGVAASGVFGNACYDFLKVVFNRTVGRDSTPTDPRVQKLFKNDNGEIDTIIDTIEGDVASIHRPIIKESKNVVIIGGSNNIVNLDMRSYDYVKAKILSDYAEDFYGNISSFNANSCKGRIYIIDEQRTVPFSPGDEGFSDSEKAILAWSLGEYVNNRPGKVRLRGRSVTTQSGLLKNLIIDTARKA